MERRHGPWTICERRRKYRNEFIEVNEDQVIQPDGQPGTYATVEIKEGVSTLALDRDGFVHLAREFRYALGSESTQTVGGVMDEGESHLQAAQRELREELGIEAREWTPLGRVDLATSLLDAPTHLFLARGLEFGEPDQDGSETIEPVRVKLEQAVEMVLQSEITDSISCALILKAAYYLKTESRQPPEN